MGYPTNIVDDFLGDGEAFLSTAIILWGLTVLSRVWGNEAQRIYYAVTYGAIRNALRKYEDESAFILVLSDNI